MASGEKLPNTNLNLIQDIDMIDYADINAIAQAVETTLINSNLIRHAKVVPDGTSIGSLAPGFWFVPGTNTSPGKPPGASWGMVLSYGGQSAYMLQIWIVGMTMYWRTWVASNAAFEGWYKIDGVTA